MKIARSSLGAPTALVTRPEGPPSRFLFEFARNLARPWRAIFQPDTATRTLEVSSQTRQIPWQTCSTPCRMMSALEVRAEILPTSEDRAASGSHTEEFADMGTCKNANENKSTSPRVAECWTQESPPTSHNDPAVQRGPLRILRLAQVLDVTGLGKTKIYELQSEGSFPMRIQITDHSVGWVEAEVQAWLAQRIAASALRRGSPQKKTGGTNPRVHETPY